MLFDKNKNMQKEVVGVGPLKLFVRVCCFGCIATRESCLQVEVTEVIRSLEALLSSWQNEPSGSSTFFIFWPEMFSGCSQHLHLLTSYFVLSEISPPLGVSEGDTRVYLTNVKLDSKKRIKFSLRASYRAI